MILKKYSKNNSLLKKIRKNQKQIIKVPKKTLIVLGKSIIKIQVTKNTPALKKDLLLYVKTKRLPAAATSSKLERIRSINNSFLNKM